MIAIDDFGTGYSGLSHLQQFPIDILKIDKSFIDELHLDPQKASLVSGIVNLGESLELEVIAEGIEQPQQAERLRAMRSPLGQGFLFSRPLAVDQVEALLELTRACGPGGLDSVVARTESTARAGVLGSRRLPRRRG